MFFLIFYILVSSVSLSITRHFFLPFTVFIINTTPYFLVVILLFFFPFLFIVIHLLIDSQVFLELLVPS